jgi:hypothetical protein
MVIVTKAEAKKWSKRPERWTNRTGSKRYYLECRFCGTEVKNLWRVTRHIEKEHQEKMKEIKGDSEEDEE